MIGNLEEIFKIAINFNENELEQSLICPITQSLQKAIDENKALNNLFNKLANLKSNPPKLRLSPYLRSLGVFRMNLQIQPLKTHKRSVHFLRRNKGAETSDIAILVSHKFIESGKSTLVDEKLSLFQAKMEKQKNKFKITPRQWHLMRHWPKFTYSKKLYNLKIFRKLPDVCSFYLFLFRNNIHTFYRFLAPDYNCCQCETNSLCMSTPLMERSSPNLMTIKEADLIKDNPVTLQLDITQTISFFDLLKLLLITDLGVHDLQGIELMKTMFQKTAKSNNSETNEEKPAIAIKIDIELEAEGL